MWVVNVSLFVIIISPYAFVQYRLITPKMELKIDTSSNLIILGVRLFCFVDIMTRSYDHSLIKMQFTYLSQKPDIQIQIERCWLKQLSIH